MVTGCVCMCSCLPLCVSLCVYVYMWVYLCVCVCYKIHRHVFNCGQEQRMLSLFLYMCCKQNTEEPQGTGDPSPYRKSLLSVRRPAHMLI